MKKLIKNISDVISDDLNIYNQFVIDSLDSKVELINTILKYIIKFKGKQFRPILCILSARIVGEPNDTTFLSASTVEILHVATLLHDDVVDSSNIRRGWPTINKVWNSKLAILIGDYMFSRSLNNISQLDSLEHIKTLANISQRLSEGEILQIENAINKNISEEIYFKMIADKTASLISASCKLGYISVSNDNNKNHLEKFGEYLGIAYQLKDDLFDVIGKLEHTGKPSNLDLKKNIMTLPYIHILNNVSSKKRKNIISKLKFHAKRNDFDNIKNLIYDNGGIDYVNKKIEEYSNMAFDEISKFQDSVYKKLLIDTIEFNIDRKF
ncbi:polyprenyl synthetase family protein [Candidatus Marinimicrobia bacterium]|nr:polyprenyl synthetase family protein [Candidatus Neomarinimicrobiota bacterium]